MIRVLTEPDTATGEWNRLTYHRKGSANAELLVCSAPYFNIHIADEGDDCLGATLQVELQQLDDLRATITAFLKIPAVEAELTRIQES